MKIGIAADHQGFELKEQLIAALQRSDFDVIDFGAFAYLRNDDYSDFVVPLSKAVAHKRIDRGIAICGSGIGVSIAANKQRGVRAGLVHDLFGAQQGVEDDDMNVMCLAAHTDHFPLAWQLTQKFLSSKFKAEPRFERRLKKLSQLEDRDLQQ